MKPIIISFGQYVQIGLVNSTASKRTAKKLIAAAFPEFKGDSLEVAFAKGESTLTQSLLDGVPMDQRALRRVSDVELTAMSAASHRKGAPAPRAASREPR